MHKASTFFTPAEQAAIKAAVTEAESKTSAEIVPVVATESGRYDRPEDLAGLWLGVGAAAVTWALFPDVDGGDWGFTIFHGRVIAIVAALILGFIVGAIWASRVAWLRRLFTPRTQMRDEVHARSRAVFFDARVHHTAGATGLLIYVSLFERMAAINADQAILDHLDQAVLDGLCRDLTQGLRDGKGADAFCTVIKRAGDELSKGLPRAEDDVNELADSLILLD